MDNRYVRCFISGCPKSLRIPETVTHVDEFCSFLSTEFGCDESSLMIQHEGKPLQDALLPSGCQSFTASLQLLGGKGGFGSMLRAIGAQIEKTTNKEACRDLSGRRLRDINQEKRVKEQLELRAAKVKERKAARKKKFESLKEQPKHIFNDSSFHKEQEEISNSLFTSIDKGLQAVAEENTQSVASSSKSESSDEADTVKSKAVKRKNEDALKPVKKRRFYDDFDDSSDSE